MKYKSKMNYVILFVLLTSQVFDVYGYNRNIDKRVCQKYGPQLVCCINCGVLTCYSSEPEPTTKKPWLLPTWRPITDKPTTIKPLFPIWPILTTEENIPEIITEPMTEMDTETNTEPVLIEKSGEDLELVIEEQVPVTLQISEPEQESEIELMEKQESHTEPVPMQEPVEKLDSEMIITQSEEKNIDKDYYIVEPETFDNEDTDTVLKPEEKEEEDKEKMILNEEFNQENEPDLEEVSETTIKPFSFFWG